ncbi:MAG TPA: molybdopterin cofactor-binding domain-containing protein, partial [Sphingomonadales bacterium]|nr:molybdopterin cofactor-binding domain-containing protein [Sphingomonadales bacterium]
LDLVAEKANWGARRGEGKALGLAVQMSYGSFCAEAAEVSIERGQIKVHKVWAAVDCGLALSPDTVKAQIMGGIVYGLAAALKGKITIKGGRTAESNFHDYEVLFMNETPEIEVQILDTGNAVGGIGEVGNPTIAPAVANAVFALTGVRMRKMPFRDYKFS